jgi:hypothetical protein
MPIRIKETLRNIITLFLYGLGNTMPARATKYSTHASPELLNTCLHSFY